MHPSVPAGDSTLYTGRTGESRHGDLVRDRLRDIGAGDRQTGAGDRSASRAGVPVARSSTYAVSPPVPPCTGSASTTSSPESPMAPFLSEGPPNRRNGPAGGPPNAATDRTSGRSGWPHASDAAPHWGASSWYANASSVGEATRPSGLVDSSTDAGAGAENSVEPCAPGTAARTENSERGVPAEAPGRLRSPQTTSDAAKAGPTSAWYWVVAPSVANSASADPGTIASATVTSSAPSRKRRGRRTRWAGTTGPLRGPRAARGRRPGRRARARARRPRGSGSAP